ncbi:MAG: ABC transporter substrate-binding protein [Ancalomicrobiaceae bacterium]|nr:ABC transporter substrate-binding protein [Ancalomicrobiaceae bacterium]
MTIAAVYRSAAVAAALIWSTSTFAAPPDPDTLIVGIASDPVTLDPGLMASYFEVAVQFNVHEALVSQRPDLSLEPGLASYECPDPTTYDFKLRPGLTFHDGTPIDAAAAKFNLDRLLDPATGSPRRPELEPIDSVTVTGPLTFEVKLKHPFAPLLQILALRAGMLISPTALKALGPDFAAHAVGAGPYKVVSWTKNSELVLERFDGYWRGPAPIKRIVFRPMPDETVRLMNLRSGALQLVDSVPAQSLSNVTGDPTLALKQTSGLGFNAFSFNTTRPPFSDRDVRRAFTLAVDRSVIQHAVYFDTATIAYGAIPPGAAWAYDPAFAPLKTDLPAARALLAKTGLALPIAVSLTVTNDLAQVRAAEILQAQAARAGFKVDIQRTDLTSLITLLKRRTFDLAISPWSGRSDPDGNLFGFFTRSGSANFSGYSSPSVDDLLQKGRTALDLTTRARLYRQAEAEIAEDAPVLFLAFPAMLQAADASLDWIQYPDGALHLGFARYK